MAPEKQDRLATDAELDREKVRSFAELYEQMPIGQLLEIRDTYKTEDYLPEARKALAGILRLRKAELDRESRELREEAKRDQKAGADSGNPLTFDTSSVFSRTERNSKGMAISAEKYNLIIGLVLCWGVLVNWVMVKAIPFEAWSGVSRLAFSGCYFGSCVWGIILFTKSVKPLVSFLGYNLVVVPFGAIVNMIVHSYDPSIVLDTLKITGLVIACMMVLGSRFPELFKRFGTPLCFCLLLVVIWEIADLVVLRVAHEPVDWIVALVLCGYIGWDWGRANQIPKTADNAIDSAAALYMDFFNLFVRILELLGRDDQGSNRS